MTIHEFTFSPTGGTRRVSELLCKGFETQTTHTELCTKPGLEGEVPVIHADDLTIIAMPVYGGRVPAMAVERLRRVEANGSRCAVVAVYGNRAYEDALVEMQDVATAMGFRVVAAVAAIAEHSICRQFAAGRPDEADAKQLASFATAILDKIAKDDSHDLLALPGNRPYKEGIPGPRPTASDACTGCGTCASQCPAEAISPDDLRGNDVARCIGCMRCVAVCPVHARSIGDQLAMLTARLSPLCGDRKQNELFV